MREKRLKSPLDPIGLIVADNLNYSADIGAHYLKSVIESKYCLSEHIIATLLRTLKESAPNSNYKPSLRRDLKSLCSKIKKSYPGISIKELENLSEIIIEERNTLVHGKMIFERNISEIDVPDLSKSYISPLAPFYTPHIVMQRNDLEISLEQESLRCINNRFDQFFDLIRKLMIELDMDRMQLHWNIQIDSDDPQIGFDQYGTRTAVIKEKIFLRDILKLKPVETPSSRYCRICKRNFIGNEVCKHLEMINEILTGE